MIGILLIFAGVVSWYTAYSLEASVVLLVLGSFLAIEGVFGGSMRTSKYEKVNFRVAWSSLSVKLLTLVSIGLAVTFSVNIYGYYLHVVSANFQLRNEFNSLEFSYQEEIDELDQTIINLQGQSDYLETEIERLNGEIEKLRAQESELQRKLRLFMVIVYGDSSYEKLEFSTDKVVYTASVKEGSYSIELRNNQVYSVEGKWTEYVLLIFPRPRSEDLGEFSLNSSYEDYEKNWGET